MLFGLIDFLLGALEIAFIVYWAVPIFYAPFKVGKVYAVLDRIFAPVLAVLRKLLGKYLPAKYMLFDWSSLLLIVIIQILQWIF